jgi:hypothetical protein
MDLLIDAAMTLVKTLALLALALPPLLALIGLFVIRSWQLVLWIVTGLLIFALYGLVLLSGLGGHPGGGDPRTLPILCVLVLSQIALYVWHRKRRARLAEDNSSP